MGVDWEVEGDSQPCILSRFEGWRSGWRCLLWYSRPLRKHSSCCDKCVTRKHWKITENTVLPICLGVDWQGCGTSQPYIFCDPGDPQRALEGFLQGLINLWVALAPWQKYVNKVRPKKVIWKVQTTLVMTYSGLSWPLLAYLLAWLLTCISSFLLAYLHVYVLCPLSYQLASLLVYLFTY